MNDNILEPTINGLPPVTDWQKVFLALQQANEAFLRGATLKEFGRQIIGDAAIQGADFEDLPIADSSAPVALPIPEADLKYGFLAKGTYTQPNGPDLVYSLKQWGLTLFDGDKWVKRFTLEIPEPQAEGVVAIGETKAPNGEKVYNAILPVQNTIDGIKTSGVVANDDYTLSNTSEYTRINVLSTIVEDGKLSKLVVKVSKVGALKIILCSKLSAIGYKIESIFDVNITSLGSNDLVKGVHFGDVDVKKGWYTGFIVPLGGAVPMLKNLTGGSVSYASNNKITVGDTLSVTASNTEWAIGIYVQGNSFETNIKAKLDIAAVDVFKSGNLAKDSYYISGLYITSGTGNKVLTAGWGTYRVKVEPGTEKITFGNFSMSGGGYSAFYNNLDDPKVAGADKLVEYAGAHGDTLLPRTVNVPELIKTEGGWYYISVKRPADDRVKSEKTVINIGATLMEYALPEQVTGIGGIPLHASSSPVSKIPDRYVQEFWSNRKATFSFIFDDINDTDELVYSIFKEFGFKPSFALKTSNLNSQVVKERYKQWYNEGCAMLSHSVTHPNMSNPDNITYQQVVDELVNSKNEINKLGIVCSGFVTPQSSLHISFLPIVDKVYGYAFTGLNAGVFGKNIHPNKMNRYSIEGTDIAGNSLQAIKNRIDLAIANGELLNFYAHKLPSTTVDVNGNSYLTEAKLREILTYIKAKSDVFECLVRNADEAIKIYYTQTYNEKYL